MPPPNRGVQVVVASNQRVMVRERYRWVWPVIVRPLRVRSVAMQPEPKGGVWLLVPSDLPVTLLAPNA